MIIVGGGPESDFFNFKGEMPENIKMIEPIDNTRLIEEIPDKTNFIRTINFNNKNYFPQGNGKNFIKWFVRFGAMGATYKKFWYDPDHPDNH